MADCYGLAITNRKEIIAPRAPIVKAQTAAGHQIIVLLQNPGKIFTYPLDKRGSDRYTKLKFQIGKPVRKSSTPDSIPFREPRMVGSRQAAAGRMDFRGHSERPWGSVVRRGLRPLSGERMLFDMRKRVGVFPLECVNPGGTAEVLAFVPE